MQIQGKWLLYTAIEADVGKMLEAVLKETLQISGRRLQKLTRSKGIIVNQKKAHLNKIVKLGDQIKVRIEENQAPEIAPIAMELDVLYEDEWLCVINKPAGMKTYAVDHKDDVTLANGIHHYFKSQGSSPHIHFVHRLDTNTSGAILVAKNSYAHHLLDQQLKTNKISRTYIAVVEGELPEERGVIEFPIGRADERTNKRCVSENGEYARTLYQCLYRTKDFSVAEVTLDTGRTHQIRVHFSHIGHPLVGDRLYGKASRAIQRQALHAHKLSWENVQTGNSQSAVCELPQDMIQLLHACQLYVQAFAQEE